MEDILLDDNGNFVAAAGGDCETVKDQYCVLQDVKHLLLTFPGDLWAHADYGAGIQIFAHQEDTELNRLELEQLIRLALANDDRIDTDSIKVEVLSWERDRITVTVSFRLTDTALESDYGSVPEEQADIVLTISQEGIAFGGAAA
jgi:hypothetical protein